MSVENCQGMKRRKLLEVPQFYVAMSVWHILPLLTRGGPAGEAGRVSPPAHLEESPDFRSVTHMSLQAPS